MAHLTADRVRETTTTTGTGAITLAGAVVGFRAFSSVLSIGDTCYYSIASLPGSEWEVGIGTYSAINTLTRTTVLSSSNAGSAVTFSAGTKEIFITAAASRFLQADNTGSYGNFTAGTITAALTGNASTATTLQTSRTIWGQSFNGSANITGVLLAPNGSAAAPALSFLNDSNTGLYTDGSDTLYVSTAGTNAAYFDADGDATFVKQVSIGGTHSPISGPVTALGTLAGGGSGYMNGTHNTVALTGGTGSGVRATVTVALGVVTGISLSWGGRTYLAGETLSVPSLTTTLATTDASGDGTTATITFAAQPAAPFEVGSQIIVAGVTPTGYNATATVTACTTTSVSYLNATTGAQTVAGTVKMGTPLTTSTIPISTVNQVGLYLTSASYPRIRLESTNTAVVAGSELGTLYFSSRDISANGSGDTTFIRGVGVGTSGGGELQFFTSANGAASKIAATISSANTLRLYNSAGTFYSDISSAATANRTVTLPDGNVTLATGTMAITGGKLSQFASTTSTELAGVISDETGSGSLVFANTPTLVTPNIGAATGTSLTTSGIITGSGGIRTSSTSFPMYQIQLDFGADLAGTWRTIITATLSAGTQYSTHGFKIKITDPNANHATQGSVNVDEVVYYVACVRTESTVIDTPDLCVVRGPAQHVQAVKTATGTYEIQVQPEGQYREYLITIETYASNGSHTIVYSNGSTAGSAGIATYSASAGGATTWVDKLQSTGTVTSAGTITTNSELVSQGSAARLSLYRSDGINYFDWASGQSLYFSTQTSAGGAGRDTKMTLGATGNLGIGTISPQKKLHIYDNNPVVGGATIRCESFAGGYGAGLEAGSFTGGVGGIYKSMGKIVWDGETSWLQADTATQDSYVTIHTTENGTTAEKFRITSGGNVGINDTSPSSRGRFVVRNIDTRYFAVDSVGAATARYDDNGLVVPMRFINYGMTAAGHGARLLWQLADAPANASDAGAISVVSSGVWGSTLSTRDSYMQFATATDGNLTDRMILDGNGATFYRTDNALEGAQLNLARAADNANAWGIDVYGSSAVNANTLRFVDITAGQTRMSLDTSGNLTATSFNGSASGLTGIKTLNNVSLIGSGNIEGGPQGGSYTKNISAYPFIIGAATTSPTQVSAADVAGVYTIVLSGGTPGNEITVQLNGTTLGASGQFRRFRFINANSPTDSRSYIITTTSGSGYAYLPRLPASFVEVELECNSTLASTNVRQVTDTSYRWKLKSTLRTASIIDIPIPGSPALGGSGEYLYPLRIECVGVVIGNGTPVMSIVLNGQNYSFPFNSSVSYFTTTAGTSSVGGSTATTPGSVSLIHSSVSMSASAKFSVIIEYWPHGVAGQGPGSATPEGTIFFRSSFRNNSNHTQTMVGSGSLVSAPFSDADLIRLSLPSPNTDTGLVMVYEMS